jgi:hypothetical protein
MLHAPEESQLGCAAPDTQCAFVQYGFYSQQSKKQRMIDGRGELNARSKNDQIQGTHRW